MPKHTRKTATGNLESSHKMTVTRVGRSVRSTVTRVSKTSVIYDIPHVERATTENLSVLPPPAVEAILSTLEQDTMHKSWYDALQHEFDRDYFLKGSPTHSISCVDAYFREQLKQFLLQEHKLYTIYPPMADVYSWSRLTPLEAVKVVILGQDPYHNVGQAHGLSFSVLPPTKIPGSLRNIYKQLANDIPSFVIPQTGDLSPIARSGVLWLNTSLTVRAHKAYSHAGKGWETFTAQVIRAVTSRADGKGVVFMAWGLPAQKTCDKIGIDETKHLVLRSAHPSPLSAHRGFIGNGHFRKANEWLSNKYGDGAEIKWDILNDE